MNRKHQRTLAAIFAEPTTATLEWARIEALLLAIGCKVIEGNGSRVKFEKDGVKAYFHRPHPSKEAKPHMVRYAREFLTAIGVTP